MVTGLLLASRWQVWVRIGLLVPWTHRLLEHGVRLPVSTNCPGSSLQATVLVSTWFMSQRLYRVRVFSPPPHDREQRSNSVHSDQVVIAGQSWTDSNGVSIQSHISAPRGFMHWRDRETEASHIPQVGKICSCHCGQRGSWHATSSTLMICSPH